MSWRMIGRQRFAPLTASDTGSEHVGSSSVEHQAYVEETVNASIDKSVEIAVKGGSRAETSNQRESGKGKGIKLEGEEMKTTKADRSMFMVDALPQVYENEGDNGSSHIYLTSPLRYKKKVNIVRQNKGPVMLQRNKWREFAQENFNQNVAILHFMEEGEDSFYVTVYYKNGCEVIGYDDIDIRNRRPRFMSRLWPLPDTEQFMLVPIEAEDGSHGYELNEDTWDTIVEQLGLEYGMIVVSHKFEDCSAPIVIRRNMMKHRCQWAWHRDHFEEDFDTFYKPYPEIKVKERLGGMYTKALMRHNGYEQMMRLKMERHSVAPERTNHVNVFGRWSVGS
ncbi:reverse transcriptase domain-containing protein [Tanacetum coccineum]